MIYTYVATALVALAVGATGAWQTQNWRYGKQLATIEAQHAAALKEAADKALAEYSANIARKDKAVRDAQTRAQKNARDAAIAAAAADSLRDDLATAQQLAAATRASLEKHARALALVFERCSRSYLDMAKAADGHAADTDALLDAWPRK